MRLYTLSKETKYIHIYIYRYRELEVEMEQPAAKKQTDPERACEIPSLLLPRVKAKPRTLYLEDEDGEVM